MQPPEVSLLGLGLTGEVRLDLLRYIHLAPYASNELSRAGSDGRRPSIADVRVDGRQPRTERPSAHAGSYDELDADKLDWVRSLPAGPPAKDGLARTVDADGGHDDAENSYYETAAHPTFVQIEAARRRFRGQYLRRLKRLAEHAR